jgi:hypothetical protein
VVERRPLDREVRGSNPSRDTMAILLGQNNEFPQCGIIKGKLLKAGDRFDRLDCISF